MPNIEMEQIKENEEHVLGSIQRWFHKYGDRLIALPILIDKFFEEDNINK